MARPLWSGAIGYGISKHVHSIVLTPLLVWAWEVYAHFAFLKAQTTVSGSVLVTGASTGAYIVSIG